MSCYETLVDMDCLPILVSCIWANHTLQVSNYPPSLSFFFHLLKSLFLRKKIPKRHH